MIDHFRQIFQREGLCAFDICRLFCIGRGNDEFSVTRRFRRHDDGKDPRDGAEAPVQSEFAQKHRARAIGADKLLRRFQNPHGDRKIETGSFLFQICGGKVDGDLLRRKFSAAVFECGAHAFFALLYGGISEPHQFVGRDPVVDVDRHFHGNAFQPRQRETDHF